MISRWHTDGGCYHLHTSDYTILHLVEDLQSLLATLEAQIQHLVRLMDQISSPSKEYHENTYKSSSISSFNKSQAFEDNIVQ